MFDPVSLVCNVSRVEVVVVGSVELHHVGLWRHADRRDDAALSNAAPGWVAHVVLGRASVGWVEEVVGEEGEAAGVSLGVADVADAVEGLVLGIAGCHVDYWEMYPVRR